jgi:hypothetical protein
MIKSKQSLPSQASGESQAWLELVREQVSSLAYGVVQITVHNARVTQIDRTERTRLDPPAALPFLIHQTTGENKPNAPKPTGLLDADGTSTP